MKLISKIISIFKKPRIVVLMEGGSESIKEIAVRILGSVVKVETEIVFIQDLESMDFRKKEYLISNFDRTNVKRVREKTDVKLLNYGFHEGADLWASDLRENGGTSFKINYQGKIVPIWLESSNREKIYHVLAAMAIGVALGLNLVQISQSLKDLTSVTK
jgi:UDP-N-acetylmuramyl pentapeptide synthase